MKILMVSHTLRREERAVTLDALAKVGIYPEVIEDDTTPPVHAAVQAAAVRALSPGEVLFLEDDILVDGTFQPWIEKARKFGQAVTFCVVQEGANPPVVRTAISQGTPIEPAILPIPPNFGWFGSQAIYLPADVVEAIRRHPPVAGGFDTLIKHALRRSGKQLYGAFPNPVQHRAPPTLAIDAKPTPPRVSLTFGHTEFRATYIDALATQVQYDHHMLPVWDVLPEKQRGTYYRDPKHIEPGPGLFLVASGEDYRHAVTAGKRVVMMEHGNGQVFRHPNGKLIGHSGYAVVLRAAAELLLVPGPTPAQSYREAGNTAPIIEIGCPKLDRWVGYAAPPADPPVVAISFHWDANTLPETGSAWREYLAGPSCMTALGSRYKVIGHGHPRIFDKLRPIYERYGIEPVAEFEEVLERAHLYINDCSSTLYEFAATGRPVVVINGSKFRKNVQHGLRFWDAAHVGINCERPNDLLNAVEQALRDIPGVRAARQDALSRVYTHLDGKSRWRARDAIMDLLQR